MTLPNRSPFFIIQEFISPLMCEDIVSRLNNTYPDTTIEDQPVKTIKHNKLTEMRIQPFLENIIPTLEEYYGFEHRGILPLTYEWIVEGSVPEKAKSDNSVYIEGKWKLTNDIDFTGILFLSDYNDKSGFDSEFEVFGGKLEFPTHRFGFTPKRGTLIVFPSGPNFIHATSEIYAGELNQVRIHFVATSRYKYDMKKFPGNYSVWFNNI